MARPRLRRSERRQDRSSTSWRGGRRGARWLRDAILAAARDDDSPSHAAMLVRASFFKDVGNMAIDGDRAGAARELFTALRPSIKRELRKERIGDVLLFGDHTDEDLVGGDPDGEPLANERRDAAIRPILLGGVRSTGARARRHARALQREPLLGHSERHAHGPDVRAWPLQRGAQSPERVARDDVFTGTGRLTCGTRRARGT